MWPDPALNCPASPFCIDRDDAYRRWRDAKLAGYPERPDAVVVEVGDPRRLSDAEYDALLARIRKTNMAVYVGATGDDPDKDIPRRLGERFGLVDLNHNWLADDDGVTSLTVNPDGAHPRYIPYTDRPIRWHTDGYYNAPDRQIHGLLLHCVYPAADGGDNAVMDPEIAYILLREQDPDHIRALMQHDAMTIPPGTDADGSPRGRAAGPVFTVQGNGALHMRYTARRRNVEWKDEPALRAAVAALEALLDSGHAAGWRVRLESGMGLLCNNVLHDRSGFADRPGQPRRLVYRARYFDRIAGTAPMPG